MTGWGDVEYTAVSEGRGPLMALSRSSASPTTRPESAGPWWWGWTAQRVPNRDRMGVR